MANKGKQTSEMALGERLASDALRHAAKYLAPAHTRRNQDTALSHKVWEVRQELARLVPKIQRIAAQVKSIEAIGEKRLTPREAILLDALRRELTRLRDSERRKRHIEAENMDKIALLRLTEIKSGKPFARHYEYEKPLFGEKQRAYLVASDHAEMDLTKE